jgi:hypothetical protein
MEILQNGIEDKQTLRIHGYLLTITLVAALPQHTYMVPTVLQEVMPTQLQTMEVPEFTSEMLHHQEAKVVLLHQLKRIVSGLEDASINQALMIQVMELFAQQ